jgi:hypothetical protein
MERNNHTGPEISRNYTFATLCLLRNRNWRSRITLPRRNGRYGANSPADRASRRLPPVVK